MALTITLTADASTAESTLRQFQASITQAMAGIDAKMQDTARKTGQATDAWRSSLTGMSQVVTRNVAEQGNLSKAFLQTGQAAQTQLNQFQRLQRQQTETARSTEVLTRSMSALRQSLSTIGAGLSLAALIQFGRSLVEAGLQMERFERTLQAATGSSKGAQEAFRFITAESNRLGQSVTEMIPIFVQLTAATRNTVLEGERTRELFSAMAGAGQAVGLSTDAVAGAMLGLTQIISQNAIQLDEFRTQFASRIPGAMLETAKALKTLGVTQTGTIAEMLKGFERGRIGVADLTQAVTMGLREIQRTAPDMSNTAAAAFTQFSNAVFQLKADLARSGLLEFMANMAQTARALLSQIRGALGLGGSDFLRQVGEIQGKLAELRQQRQEVVQEAPRSNLESTLRLEGLLGTTQAERLTRLNQEIALQEDRLRVIQQTHQADKTAEEEKARLSQERRDKEAADLKAQDAAATASRQGAQDAAARARANVGLTQERVNQEKIALDQMQSLRDQALERDYTAAVASTEQTKAAQEAIELAFAVRRVDIARQTALEEANLQERVAIETRDAKIAAIKAAESASQASAAAPGATAEAQINANKRSAASTLELQTVNLSAQNAIAAAVAKRTAAEAEAEQKISAIIRGERADQLKITELTLQREADLRQQALQGQASIISAETELVQAQVDGLILTREDGLSRIQALDVQAMTNRRALLDTQFEEELRQMERRVAANEATETDIAKIRARHTQDVQAMNIEEQSLAQTHRNELLQGWIEWVQDVRGALGNFLFDWASGQVDSITDVLDRLKSYFFRTIADMIAYAATNQIVLPVVSTVLGGLGGTGTAMTATGASGLGGLTNMFGLNQAVGFLTNQFQSLGTVLLGGAQGISRLVNQVVYPGVKDVGTSITTVSDALSLFGGIAGVGANVFSAVTSETTAGRVGGGLGAAAAGVSVASTLGLLPAVLGPIGLALAAVVPLLANVVGGMFGAGGPRFGLGGLGGVGIGAGPGGLQVTGSVTSQMGRQARIPGGIDTAAIQDSLNSAVMRMLDGMVQAINTASIDPMDLLGPTQQALNDALSNALRINSSNAKNFQQDMEDQLKFVSTQLGSFFLRPLNEAFRQLESAELDQQISRLPQTTQGMVAVFKGMNTQLDELSTVANTDVLRQLSEVRNRVEDFGNALADTARVISTSIVDQISDQLIAQANVLLDAPLSQQITRFGAVMNQSFAALNSLRTTQRSLQEGGLNAGGVTGQLERLSSLMVDTAAAVSTEIVTGALGELSTSLDRVLIQPIRVQATTVNSLFTQSLQALDTLWQQWHQLEGEGLDASRVQAQFERLLGGALSSVQRLTQEAFETQRLTDFLNVLLAIPEALTNMNPMFQQVRQLGLALAQVAQPIQQVIDATQIDLQTPGERAADTAQQVRDLQDAITDAGSAIDQVLPLYTQMAQAIQANAQAQIDAVNAQAEAQTEAINTAVDAWLDAINTWADASRDGVNQWADEMTTVINTAADAATDAWNEWATTQMEAVRTWTETMTKAINDWAQSAQTTASQLASVNATLLGEMSPAQQRATLEAQKAQLEAVVLGGGPAAQRAMDELVRVNQQLLALAKQSDNLALQKQSIEELQRIQKYLTDQLVAATGFSDPVLAQIAVALHQEETLKQIAAIEQASIEYIQQVQTAQLENIRLTQEAQLAYVQQVQTAQLAIIAANQESQTQALIASQQSQLAQVTSWQAETVRAIKVDMVAQLQAIQQELRNIFALQYQSITGTQLPGVQRGGIVGLASGMHYARGGMVPVMLEPGESHWSNLSPTQDRALAGVNAAFPRFASGGIVPGLGSGDTVPMLLPSRTRIVNQNGTAAMGFQSGGVVSSSPVMPPIVIDLKYSTFGSPEDARKVKQIIERDVIKIVEDYNRRIKVNTRLT